MIKMKELTYKEFSDRVGDEINSVMPEEFQEAKVSIYSQRKVNCVTYKLSICHQGDTSLEAPSVDLLKYYEQYISEEMDFPQALSEIADTYMDSYHEKDEITSVISDCQHHWKEKKFWKPRLRMRMINAEANEELLREIPHRRFLDLAIVYRICVLDRKEEVGTFIVRNEIMKEWGVTETYLFALAMSKVKEEDSIRIYDMESTLSDGEPQEFSLEYSRLMPRMLVLSNTCLESGAIALLFRKLLLKVANAYETDLYIFPSSIHELILISVESIEVSNAVEIVRDVNATQVSVNELLSNSIYHFSRDTRDVRIEAMGEPLLAMIADRMGD